MKPIIILAAVLVGLFRPVLLLVDFNRHVEASYQALAHILIGVLLGAWLWQRSLYRQTNDPRHRTTQPWVMQTFWMLTWIEVVCAAVGVLIKEAK